MKVLILTLGTRGDVQPFVGLAVELRQRGHPVVLAAPQRFAGLAETHGVPFARLDDGPLRVLDAGSAVGDIAAGGIRAKLALMRRMPAMFGRVLDDCWQVASTGADLIVHNGQVIAGQHVAEKLGVPAVLALPMPIYVPTARFPWAGQDFPDRLPGLLNRATYAGMKAPALMFGRTVDRWRATLGLPRRRGRHNPARRPDGGPAPVLHAISPAVLPRPDDWPDTAEMTGYWFTPAPPAKSDPDLAAFLAAGPPPVFVGFGSMTGKDPAATTRTVLDALDTAGVRGILATGWGGMTSAPNMRHLILSGDVPHEMVFPRCAAIVHHGGAGTTADAARAGRPQVVCPFVADQPFWARRMHRLGVAPQPIDQRQLTTAKLATAIGHTVTDTTMADTAGRLGEHIRGENGATSAVDALERIADKHGRPK